MRENVYQAGLIKRLRDRFPGCIILKNDSSYLQGILDLTVLYGPYWALLEVKASATSPERPNQRYYAELLGSMSYAAFVYPENEREVLDDLEQTFRPKPGRSRAT